MIFQRRVTLAASAMLACTFCAGRAASAQAPAPPVVTAPAVSDPMLAPPPPAPAELHSWDEALGMLRRSPDFLTSVAAVERAAAQRRIALAAVLPVLYAQGSYVHNFNTVTVPFGTVTLVEPPATVWQGYAIAQWNAISPRALYGVGTADLAIDVASLSLADRRRVLAGSVVSSVLATLAAARVAELDRVGLRSALERLVLTQTRLQFAKGTELDVDRAQQDVAQARALLIDGDERLRQARESLGQTLGSTTPVAADASLDLQGFDRAVSATCHVNTDVERRADVAAARERVAITERQIEDARLMFAPTLSLSSQGGYASAVTLGPLWTWTLAATITVPVYDGGVRYGAMRDARASAEQARDALASLRIAALIEVARANRAIDVDTARLEVSKQRRDLAASVDARVREGYARGIGTSLDLVTSAQALRQADIELVLAEFDLAQAHADAVLVNAECVY